MNCLYARRYMEMISKGGDRDMVDIDVVKTLYYDPKINRFRDDIGNVVHDIYRLITPDQFRVFRTYKNIYLIPDITNKFFVELIWYEEADDLELGY
jgi:hypothetical protein